MRHRRHHAALHQAQLAGQGRQRTGRASSTRPSASPSPAVRARSSSTFRRTSSSRPAPIRRHRPLKRPAQAISPKVQGRHATHIEQAVELMANAAPSRHLFRRRRRQFWAGSLACCCASWCELHGLPDHLDADGPRRLSGLRQAAGSACSACTAPTKPTWRCTIATSWSASARVSTTASPAGSMPSRRTRKKIHIDIDPSSINKNVQCRHPDRRRCRALFSRTWFACGAQTTARRCGQGRLDDWWTQHRRLACAQLPRLHAELHGDVIKPQYAVQRLYELTKDRDAYITTEVGQHQMWAAQYLRFRGAEPLDDLGRPRHHGLRLPGRGRRPGRASR